MDKKFCKYCGEGITPEAVVCTKCGRQIENLKYDINNVVINNHNENTNNSLRGPYNKWITFVLCFLVGFLGVHKFYEGKIGLGILYIFTFGLFGIGILVDLIVAVTRPEEYYL